MSIQEKQQKIIHLSKAVSMSIQKKLTREQLSKGTEIQNRLQFRLKKLEEEGMDIKIEMMEKLLSVLKNDK